MPLRGRQSKVLDCPDKVLRHAPRTMIKMKPKLKLCLCIPRSIGRGPQLGDAARGRCSAPAIGVRRVCAAVRIRSIQNVYWG